MLFADGFDEAFIGIGTQFNTDFAVYSVTKVIKSLVEGGMTIDEAIEYFEFNIQGAWVGMQTPIFLEDMSIEDARESVVVSAESEEISE